MIDGKKNNYDCLQYKADLLTHLQRGPVVVDLGTLAVVFPDKTSRLPDSNQYIVELQWFIYDALTKLGLFEKRIFASHIFGTNKVELRIG